MTNTTALSPALVYADVVAKREHGKPQPRLTAMGYTVRGGSPTTKQVQLKGETRWRRVYVVQFSNSGSCFVKVKGKNQWVPDHAL